MATTRVKRTGSKKRQSQRLHGRKTTRYNKRHNRITRRQRGGTIIPIVAKISSGFFTPDTGINIEFNTDGNKYKIGTSEYTNVEQLQKFKGKQRYERAVTVLTDMGKSDLTLNSREFCTFSEKYCQDSSDPQCAAIKKEATDRACFNAKIDDSVAARMAQRFAKLESGGPAAASASVSDPVVKLEIRLNYKGIQFADQMFEWPLSTRNDEPLEITQRMIQRVGFKDKMIKEALKVSIDKIVFFKRVSGAPGGTNANTTFVSIHFIQTNEQAMCALAKYREAIEDPSVSIQLLSNESSPEGTPPNLPNVATILLTDIHDADFTNQIDRFFGTWYEFYNERCKSKSSSLARKVGNLSLNP